MCCGMIGLSHRLCVRANFLKCRSKPFWVACEKRAGRVCQKFSLARNSKLHKRCNKRRKNGKRYTGNNHNELYSSITTISSPAVEREAEKKIRKKCHKPHEHYRNRGNNHVKIADV